MRLSFSEKLASTDVSKGEREEDPGHGDKNHVKHGGPAFPLKDPDRSDRIQNFTKIAMVARFSVLRRSGSQVVAGVPSQTVNPFRQTIEPKGP